MSKFGDLIGATKKAPVVEAPVVEASVPVVEAPVVEASVPVVEVPEEETAVEPEVVEELPAEG